MIFPRQWNHTISFCFVSVVFVSKLPVAKLRLSFFPLLLSLTLAWLQQQHVGPRGRRCSRQDPRNIHRIDIAAELECSFRQLSAVLACTLSPPPHCSRLCGCCCCCCCSRCSTAGCGCGRCLAAGGISAVGDFGRRRPSPLLITASTVFSVWPHEVHGPCPAALALACFGLDCGACRRNVSSGRRVWCDCCSARRQRSDRG